jgi:hypothetical protein
LSEDIAPRGLLQNLYVRPVIGTDGEETSFYEVPAGGGRYRALGLDKGRAGSLHRARHRIAEEDCFRHVSASFVMRCLRRIQAALVLVLRRLVSVDVPLQNLGSS